MDLSNFENLTPKNQKKVANLIQKLSNKQTQESESGQGKQNRSVRRPPATQVKRVSEQGTPSQKQVQLPSKQPVKQPPVRPNQMRTIGTVDIDKPMNATDRPNLFLDLKGKNKKQKLADMHKKDTAIDKLLTGDNEITDRDRNELINVACNMCGNFYDVSQKVVYQTEGDIRFICDNCIVNQKRDRN